MMQLRLIGCLLFFMASIQSVSYATDIAVCTDLGRFEIQLFHEDAPKHAANFLNYVDEGFYSDTVFHRVIAGFVVQGGGFDRDLRKKQTGEAVENESFNGRSNTRGTISAARTSDPHSATSQFYINLDHNGSLDADGSWGYTVFGQVKQGMEVIDAIAVLPTGASENFPSDVTQPLIAITSMTQMTDNRFSSRPVDARHEMIKGEIEAAQGTRDLKMAADWFVQYRIACGPMDPDLLLSEAETAIAINQPVAAKQALEDFFRVSDGRHRDYERARAVYREHFPQVAEQVELPQTTNLCVAPDRRPVVPEGGNLTLDEMVQTQTNIRNYIETSNNYVECLSTVLDEGELNDEQYRITLDKHNETVDVMQDVEESWNSQVQAFQEQQ